ncbi:hypothetical protein BH23ACT11_BH23ACT11_21720 [soil metagenome]
MTTGVRRIFYRVRENTVPRGLGSIIVVFLNISRERLS